MTPQHQQGGTGLGAIRRPLLGFADGRLQAAPIPWDRECRFAMPVEAWRRTMEQFFPNSAWITLPRDLHERLWAYRRRHGHPTWNEAVEGLLAAAHAEETAPA